MLNIQTTADKTKVLQMDATGCLHTERTPQSQGHVHVSC